MSLNIRRYIVSIFLTIILLLPIFLYNIGWNFDDTGYWLNTFKNNDLSFKYFNNDRFAPLNTISTKLLSILSFKPITFFIYNYILALVSFSILLYITIKLNLKTWLFPIIIIFTASFSTTFYRIFHGERELLFLWILFILIIFKSMDFKLNFEFSTSLYIIIIPINFALYYKESSVVLLSIITISIFYFLWNYNNKYFILSKKSKSILINLLILSILSIGIYICLYAKYTNPIKSDSYYNKLVPYNSIIDRFKYSIKSIFLYVTTDFLFIVFLPIIFFYTNFYNFKQKYYNKNLHKLFLANILFIISFFFILFHILIGIHSNYYLLPVYPFAILSLTIYFDLIISLKYKENKILLFLILPIVLFNSINSSINEVLFLRFSSKNFMQYQPHLNNLLNEKDDSNISEYSIYFLGVNDFTYHANIQNNFLEFYNVSKSQLTFLSISDVNTKLNSNPKSKIYFIVTPNTNQKNIELKSKISSLKLKTVFETDSKHYYELPELRHIVKYFILKFNKNSIQSPNIYREVDFGIHANF
jgi:hypothetical protein